MAKKEMFLFFSKPQEEQFPMPIEKFAADWERLKTRKAKPTFAEVMQVVMLSRGRSHPTLQAIFNESLPMSQELANGVHRTCSPILIHAATRPGVIVAA